MADNRLRALHLSTMLLEGGHEMHLEDDGGAVRLLDTEGNRICTLSPLVAATLAELPDGHAVTLLVAIGQAVNEARDKGYRQGCQAGQERAEANLQRLLGVDKLLEEISSTRTLLEDFARSRAPQAG